MDGTFHIVPTNIAKGTYKGAKIRNTIVPVAFGVNKDGVILDGFMWRMLFKTKLIRRLGIHFNEKARPREDQLFNQAIACGADTVVVSDMPVYYYRINPSSVTASLNYSFNLEMECSAYKYFFEMSLNNMEKNRVKEEAIYSIYSNLFQTIYGIYLNCAKRYNFSNLRGQAHIADLYFPRKLLKKMCKVRKEGKISLTERVEYMCLNYGGNLCLLWLIKIGLLLKGVIRHEIKGINKEQ